MSHPSALKRLLKLRPWSDVQQLLLSYLHGALVGARRRRQQLRRYMAGEILAEGEWLRLARLCGISLLTLYGLRAAIGDIARFANPRKLSAYFGLNPSVAQSGPCSCNRPRSSSRSTTRSRVGSGRSRTARQK